MTYNCRARYLGACLTLTLAACGAPPELARISGVLVRDLGPDAGTLRALEAAYLEIDSDTLDRAIVRDFAAFADDEDQPCAFEASLTQFHGRPEAKTLCLSDDFLRLFSDKTLLPRRAEMTFRTEAGSGLAGDIFVRDATITPLEAERGTLIVLLDGGHTHKIGLTERPGHSREIEALNRSARTPEAGAKVVEGRKERPQQAEDVLQRARKPRRLRR